ncbi:hypothetical protein EOA85_24045 [Mesorhizobium sp. M5C.F.Ca.IN.020.29.1.1]|uniref:hypothetical protein n=1 Tax=Mesorhizobium sp. M5C.F.Ca.IN.020.29.1.1 TaxID=2496770 RepID=UPI000FC9F1D4|nr:hypothetical protein [Mesorhizobium sp. M5C.F.Ca.IN.020.29.1.1]RUV54675.1 hypothetical protein EOA85_24045 [Mesorhizobium sp. M5C.F.Ca.IN.020.29.1.1]
MVKKAEKAGFNPLTAIRNGGSAGFTSTTTQGPGGLSAALSAAGNFLQNFDPFADAKREQESRLVEAQIANLNASTGSYNRTAATPSGPVLRRAGAAGLSLGAKQLAANGRVTVTNPLPAGVVDNRLVDADAWEARYSDIGGWIGGGLNALGDLSENIARPLGKTPLTDALGAVKRWAKPPSSSGNLPAGNAFQLPPLAGAGAWSLPLGTYQNAPAPGGW